MAAPDDLFHAARRAVRDFDIIMSSHGGLVNRNLELTMRDLAKAVEAARREKIIAWAKTAPQEGEGNG